MQDDTVSSSEAGLSSLEEYALKQNFGAFLRLARHPLDTIAALCGTDCDDDHDLSDALAHPFKS
jgi:hypothetical protein